MVNQSARLDIVFGALGSPVRRAILARLEAGDGVSVSELAAPAAMKLPAIMKHLDVLEDARLISRAKTGRTMFVHLRPQPMAEAARWLHRYERFWPARVDRLAAFAERQEAVVRTSEKACGGSRRGAPEER